MSSEAQRDADRALILAITSYVSGIGTVSAPYIFGFTIKDETVMLVLGLVTFTLNTLAISFGRRARRTDPSVTKARSAIALGFIGYLGSGLLFLAYLMSGLATP